MRTGQGKDPWEATQRFLDALGKLRADDPDPKLYTLKGYSIRADAQLGQDEPEELP